jgi:hypothetical protein
VRLGIILARKGLNESETGFRVVDLGEEFFATDARDGGVHRFEVRLVWKLVA